MNKLYKELDALAKINDNFIRAEQQYDKYKIISFSYRLASYSEWLLPSALESRGTAFVEDEAGNLTIFARPFEKFFNYEENPFTEKEHVRNLTPVSIMDKVDGSLIMVGKLPNGKLLAKTKTTINSDQAKRATEIINNSEVYTDFCNHYISKDYTPLFEYTAPTNQIVLFYPEEKLTLIGLRNMITGEYLDIQGFLSPNYCTKEDPHGIPVVKEYDITLEDINKLQESSEGNEGWVVYFDNGQRVKFKTLDYIRKHKCKDNLYNEKNLADIILSDTLDDIYPLIKNDIKTLEYVNNFKEKVISLKNKLESELLNFYENNKNLDRKNFAIKAKQEYPEKMSLLMNLYLGRDFGLDEYIIKYEVWKNE